MKPSMALKEARLHANKVKALLRPIDERLREILEDDIAHIVDQAGDGFCICYGEHANAALCFLDIDAALRMTKDELLEALDRAGI